MKVNSLFCYIASFCLMATCLFMDPACADPGMSAVPVVDSLVAEESHPSFESTYETSRLLASLDRPQDAQSMERILQASRHPNPYIRYVGMWVLGKTDIPPSSVETAVASLLTGLADPDPWVTKQSLESLGEVWQRVQDTHPAIRAVVRPAFIRAASDPNPFVRAKAAEGLEYWRGPHSVEKDLEKLLHDQVPLVRTEAYRFFPISGLPLNMLLKGLRDESASIRYISLNLLRSGGYSKQHEVQQSVIERLRDPDEQIVYESVQFLADYHIKAAIRPILDLLNTGRDWIVKRAIADYTSMPLHEVQKQYQWKPSPFVLDAPLNFPSPEMVAQIVQTVDAEDELEKVTALLRLIWIDSKQTEEALKRALRGNNGLARYTAIKVLGIRLTSYSPMATTDVNVEDIILTLNDAHPHVRKNAITLVGALSMHPITQQPSWDHGRITEVLREHVEKENDGFIKAAALMALLRMEEQIAPSVVEKLLQDKFFQVREAAVYATDLLEYPHLLKSVLSHFNDPNHKVRFAAVGQFIRSGYSKQFQGNAELVVGLRRVATTDPDEMVRTAAQQSLKSYK